MRLYPATLKAESVIRRDLSRQICSETGLPIPRPSSSSAGPNRLCETSTLHCKSLASHEDRIRYEFFGPKEDLVAASV